MSRKTAFLLGLLAATLALEWWPASRFTIVVAPREKVILPSAKIAPMAPETHALLPSPASTNSLVSQKKLSNNELVALVISRLCAWEDDDNSDLRNQRIQEMDALLSGTNMFEIVQELPPELMGFVFALPALRQKLLADPKAALDWMNAHPNVARSQALTLIHDWGEQNRDELRQYLVSLPPSDWQQKLMATASNEALSSAPAEAISWAAQMNPGASQTRLLTMAATEWAKQDSSATLQWVSQINDPALRQQLIGSAVVGYAELDPVAAATCLLQSAPTEAELSQSLAGITWAWAMKDPAAAAIWVADFPAGTTQQTALENLLNIWGNHDPAAATSWIEHLPDPALQTKAAKILLTALPAAAAP